MTEVVDRTGVEMEALTACTVAGLTVVCALSPVDPAAYLDEVTLWLKEGGRSGRWERSAGRPGPVGSDQWAVRRPTAVQCGEPPDSRSSA